MSSDLIPAPSDDLVALAAQINAEYAAAYEERDAALDRTRSAWTRVIRAGHLLRAAKDQLPHGAWLPWLREHTVIPPRTAQNWMRLAANAPHVAHLGGEGQALRFLASPRFVSEPEAEPEPAREPEPPPAPVEPPQRARTEPDALPPLPGAVAQHRPAAEAALRSADAALARAPVPAVPEERMDAAQKSEEKTAAAGCEGYIPKPCSPRQVLAMVREFLGEKRGAASGASRTSP